ncbi:IS1595 family transposase [Terracidiphilus gabretensis]|uniref:IS1595 family transposase n=1 Tax=Terracidiphilus gabretensis TaxID=1577687 RepID=UPI00071BB8EB|nr:IS1595 family transposase [Terracidiphilus gabretensis]
MSTEPKTLQQAIIYFSNPDNCVSYMVDRRWPNGVICPTCGRTDAAYVPARRVWQCKTRHPKSQFSAKVGTVMEDSPIGLDKWLAAMWLVANSKNGVSSWEVHRSLGITQKTAWFLLHRIRLAMGQDTSEPMGGEGPFEVDETFVGPDPRKMHANKRQERYKALSARPKTPVMGMLDRDSRQVRAKVVPNVKRETLQGAILDQIQKGSTVYTDRATGYDNLAAQEYIHETVNHVEEYVRGQIHTQGIENFWALMKRGLKGTYIAVEPFHLDRYIGEQVFRYNNRATKDNPLTDSDRFAFAVTQIVGKRLTYAELTGKELKKPDAF